MWQEIGMFLLKYWLEILFTAFIGLASYFGKRYIKLEVEKKATEQEALKTEIIQKVSEQISALTEHVEKKDERVEKEMEGFKTNLSELKLGLLAIQGREFKQNCRNALNQEHDLTLEEYDQIVKDHDAYKALGGNHEGDELFKLLQERAKQTFGKA